MAFSFNFAGDDIEDSEMPDAPAHTGSGNRRSSTVTTAGGPAKGKGKPSDDDGTPEDQKAKREDWWGMLSTLPSQISYTTTTVISPLKERRSLIPRRALFDVRMQIMAESDDSQDGRGKPRGKEIGLGDSDLERNVYEGGFKSWEGAMDLARLLLERGPRKDIDDLARVDGVVELGCGTALPSLILFSHALSNSLTLDFTLADYNTSVLRLVTLPNLLLTWCLHHSPSSLSSLTGDGELTITPSLLSSFRSDLSARGITLTLISGSWSPTAFPALIPLHPSQSLLLLAAETIYSPTSLVAFTDTLLAILRKVRLGKALVAAKRVYFGVGGSVDEFKGRVGEGGGVAAEVENSGVEGCERKGAAGVGRALLEVQMC